MKLGVTCGKCGRIPRAHRDFDGTAFYWYCPKCKSSDGFPPCPIADDPKKRAGFAALGIEVK